MRPNSALKHLDPEKTYDAIADSYDLFTSDHDYEAWIAGLIPALGPHGLDGRRLLDAGCGTGKSSLPMLRRGWDVTACDNSAGMLARLKAKADGKLRVVKADLRALPRLGAFNLVICLGDVLNYCATTTPLATVLTGLRRNLAPDGLLLFDLNSLATYRTFYAETRRIEIDGIEVTWRGLGNGQAEPGTEAEAVMEVTNVSGGESARAVHHQRHCGESEVKDAMATAGLEYLEVFGHGFDAVLQPLDEDRHNKAIYIAKVRNPKDRRR